MEIYSNIDKTSVTTCAFALETYKLYKRKSKLQDPVIKGSCDFLTISHNPDKFGDNRYCDECDLMFLTCHIVSHKHLFEWSCDVKVRCSLL